MKNAGITRILPEGSLGKFTGFLYESEVIYKYPYERSRAADIMP